MDDSTAVHRNRNGDAESRRTIPEFRDAGGLFLWAWSLVGRWYRCDQARREGKAPAEVRLGSDMVDDAYDALAEMTDTDGYSHPWQTAPSIDRRPRIGASRYGPDADFLHWLGTLDLADPADRQHAAYAFEGYVRQEAGDRDVGEFVTPAAVVDLMLDLVAPVPGERVYDPCFGYGGLLAGAIRRMQAGGSAVASQRVPLAVTGVEKRPLPYLVGLCRVVLAGAASPRLAYADALKKPGPYESEAGFDCIVAAPPWGTESTESGYRHFPFPSGHVEDLFLQHVMVNLRPGGRAVVALPQRPLFHADSLPLRKTLLSEYRVQAVVALPAGAFEPCTGISMNLIVFARDEPREHVRFLTVSPMAWEAAPDVAGMIGNHREEPDGAAPPGVELSSVSVRDLVLRDYELIAKNSGREVLDAEIDRLVKVDHSLQVKPLIQVAQVFSGVPVTEDYVPDTEPRILRSTDVNDLRPSDYLEHHGPDPTLYLRGGDMLVALRDPIGSINLVEDRKISADVLAGDDIALIRPQHGVVKPGFLAALLKSSAYSLWLSGHAARSTDRSLSTAVLDNLMVPVPTLAVQDAMLEEIGERPADALAVLYRLLSGIARHPVALWLEGPLAASLVAGRTTATDALSRFSAEIRSIAEPATAPTAGDRSIGWWLGAARRAAAALDDLDSVPSGSGRLVILGFAAAKFHEALDVLDGSEAPIVERLRSVTRAMVQFVEGEVYAMQRNSGLEIAAEPAAVQAGADDEVRLQITNSSPVPLRKVRVTARQADQSIVRESEVSYLSDGQRHEIPVIVRAQDATEPLQIDVSWQARRLDATPVQGEAKVSVAVRSSGEDLDSGDLGASPYVVGPPVDRDEMFFGREGIMDQIRRHVGGDNANVILLEGNRRTGKTSILKRLEQEQEDELPGWIPVYCSFQDVDSVATANVFRLLARQTGLTLADAGIETWIPDLPAPDSGRPFKLEFLAAVRSAFSGGHPYEMLSLYLAAAIDAAKPRRVLLMLDEFDKLQEGIDRGITSPQVPENIRHLLQHQPGLGAIITGSRRLKRLREEYWSALFGFGLRIGVSALPEDEARRLVTEPVARRIRYLPQARDRLVALCARHPFLIQSLCSKVFERAAAGSERTITGDAVERASTEMVRDNEHFQTLWGYAGSERRRLILALCDRMSDLPDAVNLDLLAMKFEEYGVPVRDDHLDDDIAELRELELLEIDESYRGGTYRLSIPLMAEWLRMNVVFDDLVKRARKEANRHAE